jgi:antitoxin YefM
MTISCSAVDVNRPARLASGTRRWSPATGILDHAYVITYASRMKPVSTFTATQARANLFKLLDQAAETHQPIQITGRRNNGILVSEEDFRAMQETLYLIGIPGMKASLLEARKAPLRSYSRKRPW